jgi:hypothetical protein
MVNASGARAPGEGEPGAEEPVGAGVGDVVGDVVGAGGSGMTGCIELVVTARERRSRKKEPETTTAATSTRTADAVSATLSRRRDIATPSSIEGHPTGASAGSGNCYRLLSAIPGGVAGPLDPRPAAVARVPAAGMPVPSVGQVAPLVGRPGHDVRHAGRDFMITTGAAVCLRATTGDVSHRPLAVGRGLDPLDPPPGPLRIEGDRVLTAPVLARHESRVRSLRMKARSDNQPVGRWPVRRGRSRGSRGLPCGRESPR